MGPRGNTAGRCIRYGASGDKKNHLAQAPEGLARLLSPNCSTTATPLNMKNEKKTAAMTPERREKDKVKQAKKKTVTMAAEIRKKDKSKTVEKKPATALESRKKEKGKKNLCRPPR